MRTFAEKPKITRQTKPAGSAAPSGQRRNMHSMLQLRRAIGNHAAQSVLGGLHHAYSRAPSLA